MSSWAGTHEGLGLEVVEQTRRCLATYREDASRVRQDANIEASTSQLGYGRKQLFELIQNGADALQGSDGGRIRALLTPDCLYVANEGRPLTASGVTALMGTHDSVKRGDEIGRFGLGFKSVVAISDRPQIISRTGSFGFDREVSRASISRVVPDAPRYPLLRTAEPLNPDRLAADDTVLADLMGWATTIVRVPLKTGHTDLSQDIQQFPAEFVLFSPHIARLDLIDSASGLTRAISLARDSDGVLKLTDDDRVSRWRVASTKHRPSPAALKDAGDLARRESVTISWAVPVGGRSTVGQFWAFFPTEDRTTLSGIVNAPWKMGDDRRNLLPGQFNKELLTEVLPRLVASEWPKLITSEEPAALLDVLPARGREARSWADDVLNAPVISSVADGPCIPDTYGELRPPSALKLPPRELVGELKSAGEDLLALWSSLVPAPTGWAHRSVDSTPERRQKAERLIGDREAARPSLSDWIEGLCQGGSGVAESAVAIAVLEQVLESSLTIRAQARGARVVLLEDHSFTAAVPGRVFVRSSPDDEGFNFIHADLAAMPGAVASLGRMGIQVLDRAGELRNLLSGTPTHMLDWSTVWRLARACTPSVAFDVLRDELAAPLENSARVRTRAGRFVRVGEAYLPGGVVSDTEPDDAALCIDTRYHQAELELLTELGCVAQPTLRHEPPREPWLTDYELTIKRRFVATAGGATPQMDRLVVERPAPPWPLEPLSKAGPDARLAITQVVLGLTSGDHAIVRHATNAGYGTKRYANPVDWTVREHGRLDTKLGPMPPDYCLQARADLDDEVLPVVDVSSQLGQRLQIRTEPRDLDQHAWEHMLRLVLDWDDARRASRFYAWATHFCEPPTAMRAQVGRRAQRVPTSEVAVATTEELFHALSEQNIAAVLIEDEDDARQLLDRWKLEEGARLLEQELVYQVAGESERLVDLFPKLRLYIEPGQHGLQLQHCETLDLVTATRDGTKSKPVRHAFEEGLILVTATDAPQLLRSVSDVLQLDLTAQDISGIIDNVREQKTEQMVAELRNAETDEHRLALLVGAEKLRRSLPASAIESIEDEAGRPMDVLEMAKLVRSVHGVSALQHFRSTLEEKGLNPPHAWAGGSKARRFVTDLGFSPDLAGFASDPRPASFSVEGPASLGSLHDYQEFVTGRIKDELIRGRLGRAMVSLPTGAGKTRVAVQALVEEIRDGSLRGPIVWIAQSDELCEQAVESWTFIWRALGPGHRMSVGRLWGTNDVAEATDGFQLVVATPDKLDTKIGNADYDWLTEPSVVVVDEAHTSVAPSYTRVLAWLGRGRARKGSEVLLGLTATPFRNTNVAETKRLVDRYDGVRLDQGAFAGEAYAELQARGVLAKVDHRLLEGAAVSFTAADTEQMDKLRTIPSNVMNKLAADADRNRRIVESVAGLPADWTALLFATSVDNAMALAALLTHRGVPAVAISGTTDPAARRHYIQEFKAGRIRVITNYNVLTQGFDAPAVKAVYVTRPTFSANVYQQMIGRGLRGPLNGGSEEVLIVNVKDNFQQFGDQLAFLEFEHLWDPETHQVDGETNY
jgi:superfamily II DNA or RNA helicase